MKGQLVLIVQADGDGRKVLVDMVTAQGGIAVQADDAETALAMIRVNRPVGVLAYLGLPDTHGIEFSQRARAEGYDGTILILSRKDVGGEQFTAFLPGGAELSVHGNDGLRMVVDVLRTMSEPTDVPRGVGVRWSADLVLDGQTRQAHYRGCDLHLTRSEFALLERLADPSGRVVPRDALLWTLQVHRPPHVEPPSFRAVDQHVSHLRAKLADTGVEIEPIYGVGYRLCVQRQQPAADSADEALDDEVASPS